MKKKFIEKDKQYVDLFEGENYPKLSEIAPFVSVCDMIRDNSIFVHPLDKSDPMFKNKEKLCAQVLADIKRRLES